MRRIKINYDDYITINNIEFVYKKIKRNIRNKNKIILFEDYYSSNISNIYEVLKNKTYNGGKYNIFCIYEPKKRLIMSQDISNKIINHFVSTYYLSYLDKIFIDSNIATRCNKGSSYGVKLLKKYLNEVKYNNFYILKCDINKYFYSISHNKLKDMLKSKIKSNDVLKILFTIIDSTNKSYIKSYIDKENDIPKFRYGYGLPIGNMSSQVFAILYLNNLDHYIKEKLKIKYYIRYMDDFILIHENREYLKYCLKEIKKELEKIELKLNNKTVIIPKREGINFLGYRFKVINNKVIVFMSNKNKRKVKKNYKNYLGYIKVYNNKKYKLYKKMIVL